MSNVVLVHGSWHGAWCWRDLTPRLQALGHRVVTLGLPGHGDDQTPPHAVTLQSYADRVGAALDEFNEPALLVGHSMGGIAISQAAEQHPHGEGAARAVEAGHGQALLWATEFGWATFDGLRTASNTRPPDPADTPYYSFLDQTAQATYTVRAFQIAQTLPYMGPTILWNLNFAAIGGAVDRGDPKAGYGLVDSAWQPRPVFQYLKQAPKS